VPPLDSIARALVAVALLWAAAAKLAARDRGSWLAPHGIPLRLRPSLAVGLALGEAALAALLLAGVRAGALAAVVLGTFFVAAVGRLRLRGVRRLSCGCFGTKERSTDFVLARAAAFTAVAAVAAFGAGLPTPSRDAFLLGAVAVLAVAVVLLAALVLALYRQVGVLTLRVGPGVALEIDEEGPPVGEPAPSLEGLAGSGSELVAFFTADCRICRELAPAVRALAREGVPVTIVYEAEEPDAFERWRVPGTPFAVHVVDGAVAAKGTVNTLEQLDGLLAMGLARVEHAQA
jgi:hypothetical protein